MTMISLLVIGALLATVAALGTGIGSMVHGGAFDERHSAQLMFVRVGLQALAVVLMIAALIVSL